MPYRQPPPTDPAERRRNLVVATERYHSALDQNVLDQHEGRIPTFGAGAIKTMERLLDEARRLVDELDEPAE